MTECFALYICAPCVFLWKLEEGVDPVDLKLKRWPYVFGTSCSRVQGSLSLTPLRGFIFSLLASDFISQSWQTTKRDDCTFLTQSATKDLACSTLERIVWPVEGLFQEELLSLLSLGFKNWKSISAFYFTWSVSLGIWSSYATRPTVLILNNWCLFIKLTRCLLLKIFDRKCFTRYLNDGSPGGEL